MPAETVVFDYSELDAQVADKLQECADNIILAKQRYILDTARQVKTAHDLLANHHGGLFGAWCESVDISRETANSLLRVVKLFDNSTPEQVANLEQLKPTMLYAVAKPSAPAELVEQVKNGDIKNHKDYIALKKQFDEARQAQGNLMMKNAELERDKAKIGQELKEAHKEIEAKKNTIQNMNDSFNRVADASEKNYKRWTAEQAKTRKLEQEIKELENRPQPATYDIDEVEKKVKENVGMVEKELEEKHRAEKMRYNETIREKDDKILALEDKVKELERHIPQNDGRKSYLIQLTPLELAHLMAITEEEPDLHDILTRARIVKIEN